MYNVQDYSILYNNAVFLVICEGWHFTHNCLFNPFPYKMDRIITVINLYTYINIYQIYCNKSGEAILPQK